MAKVKLMDLAIARSGDKGDSTNIGIMANSKEIYAFLKKQLTAELVKTHFSEICQGDITRYELPTLCWNIHSMAAAPQPSDLMPRVKFTVQLYCISTSKCPMNCSTAPN